MGSASAPKRRLSPRHLSREAAGAIALIAALVSPSAEAQPLVVVDPGHGGTRDGAVSAGGVTEKQVVLQVARHVRVALEKAGIRVVLTRTADRDVGLGARVAFANQRTADAFISIHANSSPVATRRGCETYVLSAQASDDVTAAMVHLENDGEDAGAVLLDDVFGGGFGDTASGDVGFIIADMRRASTHKRSAALAKHLQDAIGAVAGLGPSRGLRQAPFRVLHGARMPAALIEIGYLTNPAQSRSLAARSVQRAAGAAIAQGVLAFLGNGR